MAETGYIVFYVTFFGLIALVGGYAGEDIVGVSGGDINNLPTYEGGFFDALTFPFELAFYFIGLQGLTVLGLSAVWSGLLSLIFNVPMIYVIARLVRGGG